MRKNLIIGGSNIENLLIQWFVLCLWRQNYVDIKSQIGHNLIDHMMIILIKLVALAQGHMLWGRITMMSILQMKNILLNKSNIN